MSVPFQALGFTVANKETGERGGDGGGTSMLDVTQPSRRASHMTVFRSKFSKKTSSQKRAFGSE
jgi:hypothetical protein